MNVALCSLTVCVKHCYHNGHCSQCKACQLNYQDEGTRCALVTHGHLDHVGSLPALLEAFPKAQLAMHILEAPYVVGGASYTAVPTDNWLNYFMRFLVPQSSLHLPVHQLLYLAGKHFGNSATLRVSYMRWFISCTASMQIGLGYAVTSIGLCPKCEGGPSQNAPHVVMMSS